MVGVTRKGEEGLSCAYLNYFQTCGLTFPIPLFLLNILKFLGLAFPQMVPNFVCYVIGTYVHSYEDEMDLSPSQFFDFYVARASSSVKGSFYLTPRERRGIVVFPNKYSHRDTNWQKKNFFFRVLPETVSSLDAFRRILTLLSMSYDLIDTPCVGNTSSASLTVATSSKLTLFRRGNTDWESFMSIRVRIAYHRHARQRVALAELACAPVAAAPARAVALLGISIRPPAAEPSISQQTRMRAAHTGPSSSAPTSGLPTKRVAPVAIPPTADDAGSSSTTPSGERLKRRRRVPVVDRAAPSIPRGSGDSTTSARRMRTILFNPARSSSKETGSSMDGGGASPRGSDPLGASERFLCRFSLSQLRSNLRLPRYLTRNRLFQPRALLVNLPAPRDRIIPQGRLRGLPQRGILREEGLQGSLSSFLSSLSSLLLFFLLRKSLVSSSTRGGSG
ncbi:unnamed protein product [Arabis nemorensis]|uniref:Uncharacterized protein n=1 Tax=Arabis nemorensis TaxID=586526 RepID=A0A565BB10_9BRAS|nr:unnamed protein product [Arabis nemorensis]